MERVLLSIHNITMFWLRNKKINFKVHTGSMKLLELLPCFGYNRLKIFGKCILTYQKTGALANSEDPDEMTQSRRDIVLASSFHPFRPSELFVCPEPYLSTYWSDLIHSWYK